MNISDIFALAGHAANLVVSIVQAAREYATADAARWDELVAKAHGDYAAVGQLIATLPERLAENNRLSDALAAAKDG